MRQRRSYSPEFKVAVVLESLKGEKSPAQICRERGIGHPLLSRWRSAFLERAHLVFSDREDSSSESSRIAELERLVGKLTIELDLSKELSELLSSQSRRSGR